MTNYVYRLKGKNWLSTNFDLVLCLWIWTKLYLDFLVLIMATALFNNSEYRYLNLAPIPFKSSASCLKVDGLPTVDRYVVLDDQSC